MTKMATKKMTKEEALSKENERHEKALKAIEKKFYKRTWKELNGFEVKAILDSCFTGEPDYPDYETVADAVSKFLYTHCGSGAGPIVMKRLEEQQRGC